MTVRPTHDEWVTPGVAAEALGVSLSTLARLADRGDIRAIRPTGSHRRYAAADIEAILARNPWDAA
ncbi:helix-turn-helix domain-containing protein [Microbacterium sp. GbtcB4]|uniref:helix-turn-helix domain-containing protein n=1 Tax=Microbacterium sp. GbtcB4 TaxID=2824749 RepID=UPI001C2F722C